MVRQFVCNLTSCRLGLADRRRHEYYRAAYQRQQLHVLFRQARPGQDRFARTWPLPAKRTRATNRRMSCPGTMIPAPFSLGSSVVVRRWFPLLLALASLASHGILSATKIALSEHQRPTCTKGGRYWRSSWHSIPLPETGRRPVPSSRRLAGQQLDLRPVCADGL